MTNISPPQLIEFFKGAAIYTFCAIISIALSRYGTDPLSLFLRAYFTSLFTTDTGLTILTLAMTYPLIRRREINV
jgi:hypothetical protein